MEETWIESHINKHHPETAEEVLQASKWLRERPAKIKEYILKFPPSAVVQSAEGVELKCPPPGKHGIVVGYYGNNATDVLIAVLDPVSHIQAQCKPEWLRVTHYCKGLTPNEVRMLMEGAVA